MSAQGSPRQAAEVERALARGAADFEHKGRHRVETDAPGLGLFAIDLAGEGMPVARLVEGDIMRLAEQDRELHSVIGAHGVDRGIEAKRRIAAAPAVLAGRHAANTADMDLA